MNRLAVLALLLLAGIAPAQPPKDMLAGRVRADVCDCARTGVCLCSPYCTCPDPKAAWAAMLARGVRDNLPVVVFAGLPNRAVKDCLTVGYPEWCSDTNCYKNSVVVIRPLAGLSAYPITVLPATATDQQIRDAGKPATKPAPLALRSGEHSHICSRCGTEYGPHTHANQGDVASHRCPNCGQVNWMPARYGPSVRAVPYAAMPMSYAALCPT